MTIPKDKVLHFVAGALAGAVVLGAVHLLQLPLMSWYAVVAAAVAGAGKEAWDWWQNRKTEGAPRHTVDFVDFISTLFGGVVVAIAFDVTH